MSSGQPETVFINGRFLTNKTTGVERYAAQLISALDAELAQGRVPDRMRGLRWELVHPADADGLPSLSCIHQRGVGSLMRGHAWEQTVLATVARRGLLVSLANAGPVLHPRQLVVLHDAQIYRLPENFRLSYRLLHRALDWMLASTASIGTVSYFSRAELAQVLKLDEQDIVVIPNGADHLARTARDDHILRQLSLSNGKYFLFVGTTNRNKNLDVLLHAHDDPQFADHPVVIVGGANAGVFGRAIGDSRPGVVTAGRVTDAELAALYAGATALVFPSIYEGFGIPPLEAMAARCPVIASTAPAVMEVCGDAAAYFDPFDAKALAGTMAARIARGPLDSAERVAQAARLATYTWSRAATKLIATLGSKVAAYSGEV